MPRKVAVAAAVTLLTGGLVAAFTQHAIASADTEAKASAASASAVPPEMLAALQRDLRLTAEQAKTRLVADAKATRIERDLRGRLGGHFSGAWVTSSADQVVVAITDESKAAEVRKAGATPQVVSRSENQLNAAKSTLDEKGAAAPAGVSAWYVDVATNSVVVLAPATAIASAKTFVAASGVATDSVRVVAAEEAPRLFADVRGGDAYYINNSGRCSIGFPVQGGFVTAGHCGRPGARTTGSNRATQGTFQASTFPGRDYAWVKTNSNWTPRGVVNRYNGGTVPVKGSQEAPAGSAICRSGSTTGWHCGTVGAKNSTVRYPEGSVSGLTRTNVCAEPGDSGGSWISGDQAQGVTSGGSGDCRSGGTTYFQPVNPILSTYGLKLVTS